MTAGTSAATLPRGRLRCAVYTRKSSEEGLEQSFNSLHAQREACEAFIASQRHEGWVLVPTPYDDGGLSGGSMNRPALQRLLEDVRTGLVDIVVVYKVDRLTRSLADFAKLTELLDAHGASFVSVTQAFNTSTSMGRLTLNVLLSFAQFEREVAGERIRDKIAASKRRGMWMGGLAPLGYDGIDRQLVVNEGEAQTVRTIFGWYLECGSVAELKQRLDAAGIVSKRRRHADGRISGGMPMSRGAVYQVLRNRLYRGEIAHRGEVHRGNHSAIVDEGLWTAVQARLVEQSARPRGASRSSPAPDASSPARTGGRAFRPFSLLRNLAFDAEGERLTPSHANKQGRRYRYYVSAPLVRGTRRGASVKADGAMRPATCIRVPASDLEVLVVGAVVKHLGDGAWLARQLGPGQEAAAVGRLIAAGARLSQVVAEAGSGVTGGAADLLRRLLTRVVVGRGRISISLDAVALGEALAELDAQVTVTCPDDEPIDLEVAAQALRRGKQVRLVIGHVDAHSLKPDEGLVHLLTDAHRWFDDLRAGRRQTIAEIARAEGRHAPHVSRFISLAFLAPRIVQLILEGRQPVTLTPERLRAACPLPISWPEQISLLLD